MSQLVQMLRMMQQQRRVMLLLRMQQCRGRMQQPRLQPQPPAYPQGQSPCNNGRGYWAQQQGRVQKQGLSAVGPQQLLLHSCCGLWHGFRSRRE